MEFTIIKFVYFILTFLVVYLCHLECHLQLKAGYFKKAGLMEVQKAEKFKLYFPAMVLKSTRPTFLKFRAVLFNLG